MNLKHLIGVGGLAGVLGVVGLLTRTSSQDLQLRSERAYQRGRFAEALRLSAEALECGEDGGKAALLAGQSAAKLSKFPDAVRYFEQVPDDSRTDYLTAQQAAGQICLEQLRQVSRAEACFRNVLAADPENLLANEQLVLIYGATSRYLEQIPYRIKLIELEEISAPHLLSMALGEESIENPEIMEQCFQAAPSDPASYVTLARVARERQDYVFARRLLENAVTREKTFAAAQVYLGKLLWEQNERQDFLKWLSALPSETDHPGLWILKGDYAAKQIAPEGAVRCYAEAVVRDPNHAHSLSQLGRLLVQMGKAETAEPFLRRAKTLRRFVNVAKAAYAGGQTQKIREAVESAEELGLIWEAYAWAWLLKKKSSPATEAHRWALAELSRLAPRLKSLPRTRCEPGRNPIRGFDYRQYALPRFPKQAERPSSTPDALRKRSLIRFEDQAAKAGLIFTYFPGRARVDAGLEKMYAFGGGGVAVLDFDGDSLPDVSLAQGCRWPADKTKSEFLDRMFRNLGNGTFEDVTQKAGLREPLFSQGMTAGDFNSDGWPDLFVANIGHNRLYENNGDGTFAEVTEQAGIAGESWTTSCLLADLNGDALPDLYEVNYLGGEDIFSRICPQNGGSGMCLPQQFPAEQDRLFLNAGNGEFQDVTETCGIEASDGKGLGIVAGDFNHSGRLSVFVANDTTPNFFFVRQEAVSANAGKLFHEEALFVGLGLNGSGQTESGMGVAAGDVDGDGRLDLFVTNFHAESNTLYRQLDSHVFEDVTREWGLAEPSLPLVGFGTQFLDADLDGDLDLITANGHIDNYASQNLPYKMPPQFFVNRGDRFQLQDAQSLGAYFQETYLGRSLARWDWNQDGREDVIVSHLDAPLALLTNETADCGGFLALQLRGVHSSRDAIGSIVTIETTAGRLVRQLTAGDGYLCSNERQLVFGLGKTSRITRLIIQWPSGRKEVITDVPGNSRGLVIEGGGRFLPLPFGKAP